MSAAVMTIPRRTWNGARAALVALVIAVAILAALLIANVGNDSSASTRSVVPTQSVVPAQSSSTPGSDIACGVGHPC
jgi:hypothetical protein